MTEHVLLIGAEDVRSAGHTMSRAAETMSSAANTIDGALDRQRLFLDDWLMRFEAAVDRINPEGPTMREVKLGDGKILHMPDVEQRTMAPRDERDSHGYACDCHRRMGNDFWFLPTGSCIRNDKTCNAEAIKAGGCAP